MLRLVWRQHWMALAVMLALSAAAIAALVVSEAYFRGIPAGRLVRDFGPNSADLALQAIPAASGLGTGLGLIGQELEEGTAHFAWTQGYGKVRWAIGKLAAAAALLVPMTVVLGLVFGWWYRLYVPATGYFTMHAFALYAPAMAGWTIAGLTLGMAAAALTRREAPAAGLAYGGWVLLHHYAIVGSPHTPPGEFWPLQFAQLAILLAVSGLLTVGMIVLIQRAPALPGTPRLPLRALPRRAAANAPALARRLTSRRYMAVPRAAWRQHRTDLFLALSLLGLYVAILVITGLHIHAEPTRLQPGYGHNPLQLTVFYAPSYVLSNSRALLPPLLIGASAGAGLIATDLGRGTLRFAWVQGVTRTRWAAVKLGSVGSVLVAGAVAAGLIFQWWDDSPSVALRLADPYFSLYAPVYAGWMAVAFTTAAFTGALTRRRTAAAVACLTGSLVLAGFANVGLRSYYQRVVAINKPAPAGSLLIDVNVHHATSVLTYQPATSFWQLQAIESAGLFAVAAVFAAATVRLVRRRDSLP